MICDKLNILLVLATHFHWNWERIRRNTSETKETGHLGTNYFNQWFSPESGSASQGHLAKLDAFLVVKTGVRRCYLVPYSHLVGGGQQGTWTSFNAQGITRTKELSSTKCQQCQGREPWPKFLFLRVLSSSWQLWPSRRACQKHEPITNLRNQSVLAQWPSDSRGQSSLSNT